MVIVAIALTACTEPPERVSDLGNLPYKVSPRGMRVFGTNRVLVIPAKFAGGAPEPLTGSQIREQFFSGSNGGPTAEAFWVASGERFTLIGEVTNWVQTSVTSAELNDVGDSSSRREGDYVLEAIRAVDGLVDFGRYDNDGPDGFPNSGDDDGIVDGGIVVFNSDINTHCGIPGANGLHPHVLTALRDKQGVRFRTNDRHVTFQDTAPRGIEVGAHAAMGPLSCGSGVANNILTHELGHLLLGLPDMYHTVNTDPLVWKSRRWPVGCWELMGGGSGWGCGQGPPTNSGTMMALLGAWTRVRVGWADPFIVPVTQDAVYTLRSPATGGTVLKLPVTATEYFLVEYREQTTVDDAIPGSGVLIYHVDESLPMFPAVSAPRRYRIRLVEADDGDELVRVEDEGGDRGSAGDAFGITRTTFGTGNHSGALTTAGGPLPFVITDITIDAANHLATVRVRMP